MTCIIYLFLQQNFCMHLYHIIINLLDDMLFILFVCNGILNTICIKYQIKYRLYYNKKADSSKVLPSYQLYVNFCLSYLCTQNL